MINMFTAEMSKLTRTRFLVATAVAVLVAVAVATTVVFLSADASGPGPQRGASLTELAGAGGGTEAFSIGMSFTGILVLVLFVANWTGEFSQGTFRTLLMEQPRRGVVLAGKFAALLTFSAGVLLAAEVATWATSLILAPTQDVSTSSWFGIDAISAAAANYRDALFAVTVWGSLGMTLALLLRSTPIALGVGIAWTGPFEHLTMDVWSAAERWYPGLLMESVAVGGTAEASYARAAILLIAYLALGVTAATLVFARRDVTG